MRDTVRNLTVGARLTRDLPGFLRQTLTVEGAKAQVQARLAARESNLLSLVERAVYGHSRSPYLALLRHAGCELGDFRSLVAREGIEGALTILASQGVYATFDEMKGRTEAVRGSRRFTFRATDFDNPLVAPHLFRFTGGSGGRPSRVDYSLTLMDEWAAATALALEAHDIRNPRHVFWWPLPMHWLVATGRLGQPVVRWLYPVHPLPLLAQVAARYVRLLGRAGGRRFPAAERWDLQSPGPLAHWLAAQPRADGPLVLWTMPSAATRLAVLADEAGLDFRGVVFRIAGEPVTGPRRTLIEATGARIIVQYSAA